MIVKAHNYIDKLRYDGKGFGKSKKTGLDFGLKMYQYKPRNSFCKALSKFELICLVSISGDR